MAYRTAELPPVDIDEFAHIPFLERMKLLQLHWVEAGFGTPRQTAMFYVWKIFFYALFGLIVAGAFTKGLEFNDIGGWWDEPILYQKLMIWTVLLEVLGFAATCGPMAFHFDPLIGQSLYWWQNDTIRIPPYPNHVPFTKGNRRTPWDTGLYKLIVFWLVMMLFLSGTTMDGMPGDVAGVMPRWPLIVYACLIVLMGLRDKCVFLASRPEQYVPTMLCFALFIDFHDAIIAAKIFIVIVWMGAGVSKLQNGFPATVAIMVQNTPWNVFRKLRLATVRDYPNDLRPSKFTHLLAHVGGTTAEIVVPLTLLFSPWPWLTWVAIVSIWMLHTFILSTIPLAVPLEWNVFFMFCAGFLFGNFSAGDGYGVFDMQPLLLAGVLFVALAPIVLGAFKPQYVSFLIGMKQYAGNWASTTWSFSDSEKEDRLNERIVKAADNQVDQLEPLFGREISEIFMQKAIAFRMMHPMGRAHITLQMRHNDDMDGRVLRDGEFLSNTLTGWNFGDGHCHDERLVEAAQQRCNYEPGELVVVFTESQPMFDKRVQYRVIDAALGVVEKGWYHNDDAADEQPWLPNGLLPHVITWTRDGYVAPGMPYPGSGGRGLAAQPADAASG